MRGLARQPVGLNREKAASTLLFLVLVIALPLALASSRTIFNDGDVSWHIASGRWMLEHHAIPSVDPFSMTAAGHPWVAMEWLGDVVLALAFLIAGYAGPMAVVAAAMVALQALIYRFLASRAGPIVIAAALLTMDFVLLPFTFARPHVLVWPLLAAWTIILVEAAEHDRAPPLWAALILTLWANTHASFPIAPLIGLAIGFDALRKTGFENWRDWARFALASLLALMLNANGPHGLLYPFHVTGLAMLPLIQEWQPTTMGLTPQFFAGLGIALFALSTKGVRVPLGRLLLLLALGGLAFSQVRHQAWFVIVACCLIPPLLGSQPPRALPAPSLLLLALPLLVVRALWPVLPEENAANPRGLIAAVPPQLRDEPVFNGYSFGGPLILAGIRPYIDGRADMYGDPFVIDYAAIMNGDAQRFAVAVERYHIRWTMLPTGSRLARQLDSSKEWQRIYSDRVGVIHQRRT